MQIPLIQGDKVNIGNVEYRDSLLMNMFVEPKEIKGAKGYLRQVRGLELYADGEGIGRGGRWVTAAGIDGHYRVSGNSLIKLNDSGGYDVLGAIPGADQAKFAYSFNNVAIVANRQLFYYNPTDGLREITSSGVVGRPIAIVWADNIFVLTDGTDLYHSDPLDEENYDAVNVGNAQFMPDSVYDLQVTEDNELLVIGVISTEYFANRGLEAFTYARIINKALRFGAIGSFCTGEIDASFYMLGRREEKNTEIQKIRSGTGEKISSIEVDKILNSYSQNALSTSTVDVWADNGIEFVQFNLPSDTLIYNATAAKMFGHSLAWTMAKTDLTGDLPYRARNYVLDDTINEWICDDRRDNKIGILSDQVATHYGEIAEWIIDSPIIKMESLSINQIELETIPGNAPDNDATVFVSLNGTGFIPGNEVLMQYGTNLNYSQRFILRCLGYVGHYVSFRFRGASRSRMCFCFFNVEAS